MILAFAALFAGAPTEASVQPTQLSTLGVGHGAPLMLSSGWTVLQNNIQNACAAGTTCQFQPCTGGTASECLAPTTVGSIMAIAINGPTNVTITGGSGGGTWQTASGNACHIYNSSLGNQDIIFNANTTSSIQNPSITLSASSGAFTERFLEILPPPGYTGSFDFCNANANTTCTTSCALASMTLTATDFVWHYTAGFQPWNTIGGNSCSSPYLTSVVSDCLGVNIPSGTSAPTLAGVSGTGTGSLDSAIAFKSTAENFTFTGPTNFSLVQYTLPTNTAAGSAGQVSCSPTCTSLTAFNSTGSGNALVLIQGDTASGKVLSSVTDNKSNSWTVGGTANAGISFAYVLGATSGVTSITPVLTGSSTTVSFSLWEWHRTTGTWTLNTSGAKAQSGTTQPVSPTVTCSGANSIVIAAVAGAEGVSGMTYAQVGNFPGGDLNTNTGSPLVTGDNQFDPSNGALFNTTNCGPFIFPFENGASFSSNSIVLVLQ
jgi:hypothetical protein